ncbi:MAG TPA: orotidine-5'-phosphate decarboxylase [Gammaproteobacteria bacterium]|nr:orotidine-5'-phosphate decarboxylase [Gammaproteobacteria bacterium]
MNDPKIIVALDFPDRQRAVQFSSLVSPEQCRLKIGKELFTSAGPALVEELVDAGFDVFLDLKYHDIPNTVNRAASAAARLGVWMLNVHALGGKAMMQAAREGVEAVSRRPFLIAVTVLTSLSQSDLRDIGIETPLPDLVDRLAADAMACGLDGVVCSAREVAALRSSLGDAALLVTPGVRPGWAAADDQQRIETPRQAVADGASYLVVGRPITRHPDPAEAIRLINAEIC